MADNKKIRSHNRFRHGIQAIAGIVQNSNFSGFVTGKVYRGPLKNFCLPGMNCYSCPGAVGACPIGSLQAVVGKKNRFSFYVAGYLALIGVLLGRFVCGWLCLFGLIQELLYSIPVKKIKIPEKLDRPLRWLKYIILLVAVFLLTGFVKVENGLVSVPWFCKYLCPVGMLEGGIPLVALNADLQRSVGWRYVWKGIILLLTVGSSVFIYRPFCKYICPLGAFYGIFQRFSFLRLTLDESRCVGCSACSKQCRMNVDVIHNLNSSECIRCGECARACPQSALSFTVPDIKRRKKAAETDVAREKNTRTRHIVITAVALLLAGIFIFRINASPSEPVSGRPALVFTATDMEGNTVDSAGLFGRSGLTMLNVWASYCAPCAEEMPELSELNSELESGNVRIVMLLWDSDTPDTEEAQIAAEILEKGGEGLVCLLHNDELETLLGEDITAVPTSFLVDSGGNIIAGPLIGADTKENYRLWIEEHLK